MFRLCSMFLCLVLTSAASAQTLTGTVRVVDADTIDIGAGDTIRLLGIDAAEGTQTCRDDAGATLPCGQMATRAARRLYEGRTAVCQVAERDRYGRFLATCQVGDRNLNADLVDRGLARIYRDDQTYAEQQKAAILFGRGLWAYDMQDPAEWRAAQRQRQADDFAPDAGRCPIKGNISDNGRLYHVPGTRAYHRTRINTARGERWFCSEAEARSAGWRRAGG